MSGSDRMGRTALDLGWEPHWPRWRRRVWRAPRDVDLYLVEASVVSGWALGRLDCLSEDEMARAQRLLDPRRRDLFLVSHVVLRHVLAPRVGCEPGAVLLSRDPATGAPVVARAPLAYSLSRTAGFVAVVVARRPVGVDVEQVQTPEQARALLALLHPGDRARLRGRLPASRTRTVTDMWVRVEALLKARGVGLAVDPSAVQVGVRRRARHPGDWWVTGVRARRGVRLAVAWREPLIN